MIRIAELLHPRPTALWHLVKQCGVEDVVTLLEGAEQDQRMFASVGGHFPSLQDRHPEPWGLDALAQIQALYREYGLTLIAVEDTAPMDRVRLGLPGEDEELENIITQIRAMGQLGIGVLCYNWMAFSSWARTETGAEGRGGALVTGFQARDAEDLPHLALPGSVSEQDLWDSLHAFLEVVLPVAEEAGVRLALHPDDPPLPSFRGVPRIIRSIEAYRQVQGMHPSPSNAITFCQGNFALMTDDVPGLIREFGKEGLIAFVHFRDVVGTATDFLETFHDEGPTDMAECIRAYVDIDFDGPLRPDHVPTMHGEDNAHPGYGTLGRLFALGYIRGLQDAATRRPAPFGG